MRSTPLIFVVGSFVAACSVKVAKLPAPGETLRADSFILEAGGKGLNHAVGARRLGADVDGLIAVGDDFAAHLAQQALASADLPARMLVPKEGPSGGGVGFVDACGENSIAVFSGANAHLSAADIDRSLERVRAADVVTAQFEVDDAPILTAFAAARRAGAMTLLNPSPYRPIDPEILSDTDYLIMNAPEFRAYVGQSGNGPIDSLLRGCAPAGPMGVVVTDGAHGAWACRDSGMQHVPAFMIEAIDSIGAGDAFLAGLAVALGSGRSLAHALVRASACGAITASRSGVLAALPNKKELAGFLATRGRAAES